MLDNVHDWAGQSWRPFTFYAFRSFDVEAEYERECYPEQADPESVCLPCQVSEEPKEASGLTLGSMVSLFEVKKLIKKGSFGKVYLASHVFSERVKVALKYIVKRNRRNPLKDDHSTPVLAEVAMLFRLMKDPPCPNIIRLHDWIENESDFVLIMEYPESCQTLTRYITFTLDIDENQAPGLMRQFIRAVKFCVDREVFHRLELKLIDFSCALPITSEPFNSSEYQGARLFMPPEILRHPTYHANPAYVWAAGIVLFQILHSCLPFENTQSIKSGSFYTSPTLSSACQDLIFQCLNHSPVNRLQLHQVEEHRWFNPTSPNPVQQ
ncbi:serine/threonine-protein kinase pim-1-like [Danio aesculapii]|uniref:serine/threonine-protein kinase pim-1-like n=1 Tax=Danio aesculapii TaxID=1142201 RepID=UPI0024BFAF77|nr:serine/threonine-protein kinase pim-1-like [Danio aesculapii]